MIIAAAGCSSRLGRPKQLLQFKGRTLLAHTIEAGLQSRCRETVVVLGAECERIRLSIEDAPVRIVENESWQEGIAGSIRCGLKALELSDLAIDAAIIATCDQPFLSHHILNALIEAFEAEQKPIVACRYSQTLGTPVLFQRSIFPELNALAGLTGAKQIIMSDPARVAKLPFPDGALDIDTLADYEELLESTKMPR